jgi:glucose-6-phosphate 1-dehydrogenase
VETFAALRLEIDSWRWRNVPFYIRAGKNLPATCTEVLARFRKPPTVFKQSALFQNHLRFRISPEMTIAVGTNVMAPGEGLTIEDVEMVASRHPRPEEMEAYERVLGDAMAGDATLFARQDYVEEAWRIVDPVLKADTPIFQYEKGSWGPSEVEQRISPDGGWHNPITADQEDFRLVAKAS